MQSEIDGLDAVPDLGELEFRELADNAPVMIWRSRPDKLCDWFNRPWRDYSGRRLEELCGYGWAADVHPDDLERCVGIYERAFDARERFAMPYRLRRHDGEYRWILDSGAPYYRSGQFAGYFGSCVDITEQREQQEYQRLLRAELDHRMKNNLQMVVSYLQLAQTRAQGEEARAILCDAIARLRGLGVVHEQLHSHEGGGVDLGEYLPTLARCVFEAQGGERALLESEAQGVRAPFALASNLGLIVNELVTNAIKHGAAIERGLRLRVSRTDAGTLEVVLADGGPGFAEAMSASPGGRTRRGAGLVDTLARTCGARLYRENAGGARVRLLVPLPAQADQAD
ncbi:sensor histidine kinase [Coralloluteibacterium thermophilus]|uniref:histidine kinase n=1 Tax=Coralloluteibacterium thermophilum TaxID=2707049 RepID=A0ABV9NM68_9GAMM